MANPALVPRGDQRPVDSLLSPIQSFLRIEAAGGILLLACTVIAMVWANSPWAQSYDEFWHTYCKVGFGDAELKLSLAHFVNDGLMAIFFFVVGLEIKREMLVGELASLKKAALPIAAAIGGMVVPALIYVGINFALDGGAESSRGWGIPMATDIAFAVGIMALLGRRVPLTLKIFLTALAIVDDLGAVLVIAIFYTSDISFATLGAAGGFLVLSVIANRAGIRTPVVYAIIGLCIWVMLLQSGVHATIGGVLLALTIPAHVRIRGSSFVGFTRDAIDDFEAAGGGADDIMSNPRRQSLVHGIEVACEHVQTPLNRLEHGMHAWVAFLIMPVFALANAGIPLKAGFGDATGQGVALGVALGLLVGKPVGVGFFAWGAVTLGFARMPEGIRWPHIVGAGLLAGVGFTMSLFITNLAFRESGMLQLAKVGVLSGSAVAAVAGLVILHLTLKPEAGSSGGSGGAGRAGIIPENQLEERP